jgi:hypothetical protein
LRLHAALFLFVTHNVNSRAMSRKVTGFVQAQNWFQDFSPISTKQPVVSPLRASRSGRDDGIT